MSRSALHRAFFMALLLCLSLSSTALASVRLMPVQPPQPQEDVTRAGVSVVRLLVSYIDPKGLATSTPVAECTGLGVIVSSWKAQKPSEQNNWVLTDGSLLSSDQAVCAPGHPAGKLTAVYIFASSAYKLQPIPVTIGGSISPFLHCSATPCSNGPALLSFPTDATDTRPFLDVATQDTAQTMGIALSQESSTTVDVPPASTTSAQSIVSFGQQVPTFLTPRELALNSSKFEVGTPIVDQVGKLTGLRLSGQITPSATDLQTFVNTTVPTSHGPNPVHDDWNKGVDAYFQKNYSVAHTAFAAAVAANPEFQAARDFDTLSQTALAGNSQSTATSTPSASQVPAITINGVPISYRVLVIVLSLLILVILLVLTSILFGRARSQRAQRKNALKKELEEAERRAAVDAQHIAEMEAAQRAWSQQTLPTPQSRTAPLSGPLSRPELPCPNCGRMVPRDANFCPNCRMLLSPTESGLHLRVFPPTPGVSPSPASAPPPPLVQASPSPVVPSNSVSEQPTIEMVQGGVKNGNTDMEQTIPFDMQQMTGRRLGFAVGTRSDPGIKRKYKPNEDSLFAAQGMLNGSSTPPQFGLFVIADGMGGHANGQDASRLAIQTIIDYLLPKLSGHAGVVPENSYEQLLVEGVQTANQAVHQHNMDQRADMGTTVTAALIVDTVAYVANVGDSRTYLYREGEGLKKITNDHSVVASLVEAGIIKPDDIYTHPKRNQIYRSLGEKPAVEVDSFSVQLRMGDKLLLCSDGLWDMVRDPKIEDVIKAPVPDPGATGDALIQAAFEGGGEDNVSVIVVHITDASKGGKSSHFQLLAKPDTVQLPKL
ncbi:MAG TPA: protein phosphatase 2C domain-containing protein [Ktedonobacteraceae bacterium]|nr:protein phosphatase 2C domain-containing protein [Ktedonobacteraceae bacterium]